MKWHPSTAERCSSLRESTISQEEQSLMLSGWIKESCIKSLLTPLQATAEMNSDGTCRRRADGNTWRTCANRIPCRRFGVGFFFSMRTWVRGTFLFFMWDPKNIPHLLRHKRVKQELSCKPLLPMAVKLNILVHTRPSGVSVTWGQHMDVGKQRSCWLSCWRSCFSACSALASFIYQGCRQQLRHTDRKTPKEETESIMTSLTNN